jgi:hypothetical protein
VVTPPEVLDEPFRAGRGDVRRGLLKAHRHGLLLTAEGMRIVEDLTVSNDEDPPASTNR